MREWDEITRDLIRRRDEKIAHKKAQMRMVKKAALSAMCLCITATAGICVWKTQPDSSKLMQNHSVPSVVTVTTSTSDIVTTSNCMTTSANIIATDTKTKLTSVTTLTEVNKTSARNTLTAAKNSASAQQTTTAPPLTTITNKPDKIVTTDIDTSVEEPVIYERNVIMRKFLAVLAAASTMVNPITANSSPIVRFDPDSDLLNAKNLNYDIIESGELDTYLNGDGKFDIHDVHYAYETYNENFNIIYNYYLRENGIIHENYNINNFKNEEGKITDRTWHFFDYLGAYNEPNIIYNYNVKYDRENNISLDFNEDGVVDVKDCLDYWVFDYYLSSYVCWFLKDDYAEELKENYDVYPDNKGWSVIHRLDSILGRESEDIGFCIPSDKFILDFPLNEITLKNCAEYYLDHWYTGIEFGAGAIIVTKEIISNYDFSEEWLNPEYCHEYLLSNVDPSYLTNFRYRDLAAQLSGVDEEYSDADGNYFKLSKYEYRYMGEARVDAIEAGLVKYEDYCDILSWHSKNHNYLSATYPDYEKAVTEGRISVPDMNADGKLDDLDMEILSACYRVITVKEYSLDEIVDTVKRWYDPKLFSRANIGRYNVDYNRPDWNPDGNAIASLDCNENGIICDDYDVLFAGIYISKFGTVDFDLYNEFFASELYQEFENRTWRYYDRDSGKFRDLPYGVYYEYIVSLADLLFDMDKANNTPPTAPKNAPYRTGDASVDGEVAMNDVVLIMQTLCNPNKYRLSIRGEFNADVNNTNDGITPMDALVVQQRLLNQC